MTALSLFAGRTVASKKLNYDNTVHMFIRASSLVLITSASSKGGLVRAFTAHIH